MTRPSLMTAARLLILCSSSAALVGCSLLFDSDSHTAGFDSDAGADAMVDAAADAPPDGAPPDGAPPDGALPDGGPGCPAPSPTTGDFTECAPGEACNLCTLAFAGGHEFGAGSSVGDLAATVLVSDARPPSLAVGTVTLEPLPPRALVRRLNYNPMMASWTDGAATDLGAMTPDLGDPAFLDVGGDDDGFLHATVVSFDPVGDGVVFVGLEGGRLNVAAGPVFGAPFHVGGGGLRHGWAGFMGETGFFASSDENATTQEMQTDPALTPGIVDGSAGELVVADSSEVRVAVWNAVVGGEVWTLATPGRTGDVSIAWGGANSYVIAWANEGLVHLHPLSCTTSGGATTCCPSLAPIVFGAPGNVTALDITGLPGGGYALALGLDSSGTSSLVVRFYAGDMRAVTTAGGDYFSAEAPSPRSLIVDVDGSANVNSAGPQFFYGLAAHRLDDVGGSVITAAIMQGSCGGGPGGSPP